MGFLRFYDFFIPWYTTVPAVYHTLQCIMFCVQSSPDQDMSVVNYSTNLKVLVVFTSLERGAFDKQNKKAPELNSLTFFHELAVKTGLWTCIAIIKNRIYIREELKESLGMNFFSPFQPEREFKVYKSCKCSQIMCSEVH